jgi:hypothetical protein
MPVIGVAKVERAFSAAVDYFHDAQLLRDARANLVVASLDGIDVASLLN